MPTLDVKTLFAFLGALFLLLGGWRCLRAGAFVPQGRTWLILGVIFGAVAAWLWVGPPGAH